MSQSRSAEELDEARRALKAFARAGYELFPLKIGTKVPRDVGWQSERYSLAGDIASWVKQGGNVGVRLRDVDLVLDLDPRNFAQSDDPFKRLCADAGSDLFAAPAVITGRGDGGRHIYYHKPPGLRLHGKLKDRYPGIDFRSVGSFVVAPGSVHPETGRLYVLDDRTPPISEVGSAPEPLLELLARPDANATESRRCGTGKLTNEQLTVLLAALDPTDYGRGHYDEWIRLAAACHDATAGTGLTVWLEWCADDPAYGDDATFDANVRVWESFTAGRPGGATFRTLLKAVVDAGRPDLVATFDNDDDALEENFLVYEIETEEKHDG